MMSLDDKIKNINKLNEEKLRADIADYETLLNSGKNIQHAIEGAKKEFNNIKTWGVYDLGYHKISVISIINTDSGYEYTQNIDYGLNDTFGKINILSTGLIQDGTNIIVTFNVKEHSYKKMGGNTAFIVHHKKSRDEIIALKKEAEAKLNDNFVLHPVGWPYFDDVCYLTTEQLSDYEKEKKKTYFEGYNYEILFMAANYIMYLFLNIQQLKNTQKHTKRIRAIAPPVKEIISILKYIEDDHEATEPLIRLLATFEGDHSREVLSYHKRIAYKVEKETAQTTIPPALNMDKLSELKIEYKEKINDFYNLIKQHNTQRYRINTETLLLALNIAIKPSDI